MAVLYIRNFPEDLHVKLKVEAAKRGTSLKKLVIQKLKNGRNP